MINLLGIGIRITKSSYKSSTYNVKTLTEGQLKNVFADWKLDYKATISLTSELQLYSCKHVFK